MHKIITSTQYLLLFYLLNFQLLFYFYFLWSTNRSTFSHSDWEWKRKKTFLSLLAIYSFMVQPLLETLIDTLTHMRMYAHSIMYPPPASHPRLGYSAGCYIVIFCEAFVLCPVTIFNLVKCQPFSFRLRMLCRILGANKRKIPEKKLFIIFSFLCTLVHPLYIFFCSPTPFSPPIIC